MGSKIGDSDNYGPLNVIWLKQDLKKALTILVMRCLTYIDREIRRSRLGQGRVDKL
jgi:hypothetical protein